MYQINRHYKPILYLSSIALALLPNLAAANVSITNKHHVYFSWNDQPEAIEKNITSAIAAMVEKIDTTKENVSLLKLNHLTKVTIKNAIAPYGYFTPNITVTDSYHKPIYTIHINIKKNKPIIVRHINISIHSKQASWTKAANRFPLKSGDRLLTTPYTNYKNSLFQHASALGYLDATMNKSQITINRRQHWADIAISFTPGHRFRFGPTTFHSDYFHTGFLKRFVKYHTGKFFNSKDVIQLQNDLQSTHYFSLVSIAPKPTKSNHMVDMHVYTHMGKRAHYTLGAGYGTDTGARATIGLQLIPVNKYGHTFQIITKLANQHSLLDSIYSIPGRDPINTQYHLFTHLYQNDLLIGDSYAAELGADMQHIYHFFKHHNITQTIKFYRLNDTTTYNLASGIAHKTKFSSSMFIGALELNLTPPITSINATHSFNWSIAIRASKKGWQSPIDFSQYTNQINYLKTIHNQWRFVLSNQLGYTDVKSLYQLPLSLQLIAGGSNSLRGYQFGSIGPGHYLIINNIDIQRSIKDNWFLGVFYDIGMVSNDLHLPLNQYKQSVGPTITRSTPLGGLTISFAKRLNEPNHRGWYIAFNWGQRL